MNSSLRVISHRLKEQLTGISDAPGLEVAWLLERVTDWTPAQQRLHEERTLTPPQLADLNHLVTQRLAGTPLAYVLGEQHFWTLRLAVTPAVLIPRPETELVVERALHHVNRQQAAEILDLGTGSGAIALAVASERPLARLLAVDQSAAAVALAECNASLNGITNIAFQQSDWFSAVPRRGYDLILSNPPYIAEGDPHVAASVTEHEPKQALFAGSDGLAALRIISGQAADFLAPGGWLVVEHGWQQAAAVRQLLESAGLTSVASHADLAGHLRVSEARLPA